jgi:hypothetical protein
MMSIDLLVADEVASAADWRLEKAAEFPDYATQNLKAAATLKHIAAELRHLRDSELQWRVNGAYRGNPEHYGEILSKLVQAVGFRSSAKTAAQFLQELFFLTERFEREEGEIHWYPD